MSYNEGQAESIIDRLEQQLADERQRADAYHAVLEAAGYEMLDHLPQKPLEFCKKLGETAKERTLELRARADAAEQKLKEER